MAFVRFYLSVRQCQCASISLSACFNLLVRVRQFLYQGTSISLSVYFILFVNVVPSVRQCIFLLVGLKFSHCIFVSWLLGV